MKRVKHLIGHYPVATSENKGSLIYEVRKAAAELLELAKNEIYSHESLVEYAKTASEEGKAEALKNLPRWRKEQGEMELAAYGIIGGGVASQENPRVYLNGHSIDLYSLKKLPGFND